MRKFFELVVRFRKYIIIAFLAGAAFCAVAQNLVNVNYDINKYLPDDANSTQGLNKMQEQFTEGIPNARVMIKNVTIPEALTYKKQLASIKGVDDVTWLDDSVDITTPIDFIDEELLKTYYVDSNALMNIVIDEEEYVDAIAEIRNIIGEDNALAGNAVNIADGITNTVGEVRLITVIAVLFVLFALILSTQSWVEPFIVLLGLGVAILINSGTNIIYGTISFVTNSAGNVLLLAVSLDYIVFLIHRFEECNKDQKDPNKAMVEALLHSMPSILASGLTTVIGFLAVILMRFKIGPDVGLALAKGVLIALITNFIFMPAVILATRKLLQKTKHRPFLPSFKTFSRIVGAVTVPLVVIFTLIIIPAYKAYTSNDYYYGASHLFSTETRTGRDAEMIRKIFGDKDNYVILIPSGDTAKQGELSNELHHLPEVSSIISYVDTVGATIPSSYLDESIIAKLDSGEYSRMIVNVDVPYEGDQTFALVEKIRQIGQRYYGNEFYLAGQGVSTYDLKNIVTDDMMKVNFVAIGAVFIILLVTMRSIILPILLILCIETAIALNLSFSYFGGETVFYIAYLIISSIQLGATVDYAILMTDRYKENRQTLDKKAALRTTVANVTPSILVSGSALSVVGMMLGVISSNQLIAQLGIFIGRGAMLSLAIVLLVLPGILYLFDKIVTKKRRRLALIDADAATKPTAKNSPAKSKSQSERSHKS